MDTTMTLYTFAASQSSEKVRWLLDAAGLRYHEVRLTPFLHLPQNRRISGGFAPSVPILEVDGETLQDSTRILEWLEVHRAPFELIPTDAPERAAVMQAEARFDMAGPHVVRLMYATLLEQPELVRRLWTQDAKPLHAGLLTVGFPVLKRIFSRGLGITPAALHYSERLVERALRELDRAAEQGRRYLVGDRLSAADVTAAARFAPLICPDEHPVFSQPEYRDALAPLTSKWEARPAFDWVRAQYHRHRRVHLVRSRQPRAAGAGAPLSRARLRVV